MWLLLVLFLMRLLFSLLTKWRNWFHFSTTFMSLSYAQQKIYTNTHNLVHARTYTLTKMNEKSKNCKQTMVVVPFYFVLLSSHWWFPMESRDKNESRDWRWSMTRKMAKFPAALLHDVLTFDTQFFISFSFDFKWEKCRPILFSHATLTLIPILHEFFSSLNSLLVCVVLVICVDRWRNRIEHRIFRSEYYAHLHVINVIYRRQFLLGRCTQIDTRFE